MIIYHFNYTILPTIPLNTPIQQPTNTQYTTLCGAIGTPSASVEPYVIDICGYFPSITNPNIQFLMQKIGEYYSVHRVSLTLKRKSQFNPNEYCNQRPFYPIESYTAIPLNIEHHLTITGTVMTRIFFIITSGSSTTLGSNIEPLPSMNDIFNTIPYRTYQQCIPYLSLDILLRLELCISLNEIPSWIKTITDAVSTAMNKENINIMLKGVQEGVTTAG